MMSIITLNFGLFGFRNKIWFGFRLGKPEITALYQPAFIAVQWVLHALRRSFVHYRNQANQLGK